MSFGLKWFKLNSLIEVSDAGDRIINEAGKCRYPDVELSEHHRNLVS